MKSKQNKYSRLIVICIYIAFVIAITQIIGSQVQKYVIDNKNYFSATLLLIFIVLLYGFFLFVFDLLSGHFIIKMFGFDSETRKEVSPNESQPLSIPAKDKETKIEKPKDIDYDSLIDDLIQKIDNEKSLFTTRVELHVYAMTFYFVGVYIAMVVLVMILSIGSLIQNITFAIAVGAFLLAYLSFDTRGRENNVVEANFWKAIKKFKIEEKERRKKTFAQRHY